VIRFLNGAITDHLGEYTRTEAVAKRDRADELAAKLLEAHHDCLRTGREWKRPSRPTIAPSQTLRAGGHAA
jgi:hypothetical protein